ncbi:MAG: class I SAM-dependent methyltransferase [Candidatus Hodarchaeota archaeon]
MPDWDDIFAQQGRVFTEPHSAMAKIMEILSSVDRPRILDLGCGTGRHLVYFAKRGIEVHGFDSSLTAISIAESWLEEEGVTANLSQHRMEKPFPYSSDFFDAVISIQVIHHNRMKDILATVSEIERVLRAKGILFVTIPQMRSGPVSEEEDWHLEPVEPGTFIPRCGPEAGIPHHYFTLEEIQDVFQGFDIQEIYVDETDHRCILGIKKD